MTLSELRSDPTFQTPALQRGQVVELFRRCGLGGERLLDKLLDSEALKPLRKLPGAKQARYSRDAVFQIVTDAFSPAS